MPSQLCLFGSSEDSVDEEIFQTRPQSGSKSLTSKFKFIIKLFFMLNNHCLNEEHYDGFKAYLLQNIFQTNIKSQ